MATNVQVCDIDPALGDIIKKFKFRKEKNNAAIILKIDKEAQKVVLDDTIEELDLDELVNELPASQPRYVLLSYEYKREGDAGRVSYPFCFIFVSPQGCQPELTMMYAGTKQALVKFAEVSKVFEVRSTDELSEEWLLEKLSFFK